MSQKILVVDDDPRLRKLLTRFLGAEGFEVETAPDATHMNRQLLRGRYDLMILDVMLPGENGYQVCRRLRDEGNAMSVIMLTAKGDDVDRVMGLEMGADDYVPKPFNPRELAARINAVLRRRAESVAGSPPKVVKFGPFSLNLANRALKRGNRLIPITTAEFSLLKVFALHPGEPLSRATLAEQGQGREREDSDRSIDLQVSRLRKLLGDDPQRPRLIKTVWGFGYVLLPEGLDA
jgi:two-component system, OmpR family, phosphate regulon response regulator OmpR